MSWEWQRGRELAIRYAKLLWIKGLTRYQPAAKIGVWVDDFFDYLPLGGNLVFVCPVKG